jgi:NAD(P)-dependent dehydrogenase (short-subunit alcohol dehydrogenase family)
MTRLGSVGGPGRLEGRRAVVLGASKLDNMGQAIARRFAAEGAKVLVAGRHGRDVLDSFAAEIGGSYFLCDITQQHEVAALTEFARQRLGGVDIAVNATGWGLLKPFLETTVEEMDSMAAIQLRGPFVFFQEMIRAMVSGGSIIQISSVVATIMCPDHAAYMATKAATDHLIRVVADEFGARGIRANSISPALTSTPMSAEVMDAVECFVPHFPLGRICSAEDIAAAALWLASDECFMSGENLQVNGGFHLRRHPSRRELADFGLDFAKMHH